MKDRLVTWNDILRVHDASSEPHSVFILSNHPNCGGEPKFYQGVGGYLGSIMTRRPLWWIWTLAHIMIFSKFIILKIERVHPVSSFPSRKVFALISGSLFVSQVVGRVATISVSWHLNYRSATEISRICIYQVDYLADCHPPFRSTHLMTIWDTDRSGFRNSSDCYIFQCYSRWEDDNRDENLQLHHLTNDLSVSKKSVEQSVEERWVLQVCADVWWFLVQVIPSSQRTSGRDHHACDWYLCYRQLRWQGILLLRHVTVELHPRSVSRP